MPSPSLSREQQQAWKSMIEYLGFPKPTDSQFAALGRFSVVRSHETFEISNGGVRVVKKMGFKFVCAVGEGLVERGGRHAWRMKKVGDGYLAIGIISESAAHFVHMNEGWSEHSLKWGGFHYANGGFKPAGQSGYVSTGSVMTDTLKDGDTFTLTLDTALPHTPTVQLNDSEKMPLPREWEGFRLVVVVQHCGTGVEIVSVDS
eukprot:GDKI01044531.1.p1 GENE.GDKI01044531.1~~GDKI01044531.1.p1  ORF type:complete len:227 (+),score=44.63 GDKI01044531.1:73-681(+)